MCTEYNTINTLITKCANYLNIHLYYTYFNFLTVCSLKIILSLILTVKLVFSSFTMRMSTNLCKGRTKL